MSLEILLRGKRPPPSLLVAQEIQPEPINNIDDLLRALLERLLLFFGRRVGPNVDIVSALCDLSAVDLVDNIVNILKFVGIGDDLVAGYNVL